MGFEPILTESQSVVLTVNTNVTIVWQAAMDLHHIAMRLLDLDSSTATLARLLTY